MLALRKFRWLTGIGAAAFAAALVFGATVMTPQPAAARVFVGVGFGFPGFYYPGPYYYPYYNPYYYPPPAWYPPPPPPAAWYPPPGPGAALAPSNISYTDKPGWTDAQGRQCREYRATRMVGGRSTEVFGTACRDFDGQWRVID